MCVMDAQLLKYLGVADPRYDFFGEILSYSISSRLVHPLNQQRQYL
mgnify:FL=1